MTTPAPVLLDTDILSSILRRNPIVFPRARAYLAFHGAFTFSIITRFEILRGLKVKNATKQQLAFDQFSAVSSVLPLTDLVLIQAADIYADLHRRGELIGDADILIAATALVADWALATNNERHFSRVEGLRLENWLK